MSSILETTEFIVKSILPKDESVEITSTDENGIQIISITVAPTTAGLIIGKNGHIIKSIRTLLNIAFPQTQYRLDINN